MAEADTQKIDARALELLKAFIGGDATWQPGQLEAIRSVLTEKRVLVVQKTGWGKSMVYFIAAKMFSDPDYAANPGYTLVVSPLTALIRNQIESIEEYNKKPGVNLTCGRLDSTVKEEDRNELLAAIRGGKPPQIVFTTPETLMGASGQVLRDNAPRLFVIDEAHCISEWGHDFRLDYIRLGSVVENWKKTTLLATTATATARVMDDLEKRIGSAWKKVQGSLERNDLEIKVVEIEGNEATVDEEKRDVIVKWLEKQGKSSGIIYCRKKECCKNLAEYLNKEGAEKGITAWYYHSDSEDWPLKKFEEKARAGEKKVIVATTRLSMGYDNSDIRFVIHYDMPSSPMAYYQQIGRAGRDGKRADAGAEKRADAVLLYDKADMAVLRGLVESAFPKERRLRNVAWEIKRRSRGNGSVDLKQLDYRVRDIFNSALPFLISEGCVRNKGEKYEWALGEDREYDYPADHYHELKDRRLEELDLMKWIATGKFHVAEFDAAEFDTPKKRLYKALSL